MRGYKRPKSRAPLASPDNMPAQTVWVRLFGHALWKILAVYECFTKITPHQGMPLRLCGLLATSQQP
jgi:hypothetical protein